MQFEFIGLLGDVLNVDDIKLLEYHNDDLELGVIDAYALVGGDL